MAERAERAEQVVPAEVAGLLEERSRIRGWLERLADLKEEATPAVYTRVRDDYESRLDDVGRSLAAHREELEASLGRHREAVDGLQAERDERAAELEEAKLRFTVGEYDEEEWNRRRESCESALAGLDGRLAEQRAAVDELTGVLSALASDGSAPAATRSEPTAPPTMAEEAEEREPSSEPSPDAEGASQGAPPGADADQGAVTTPSEGAESAEAPGVAAEAAAVDDAEFLDELEFLESLSLDEAERFDAVSAMLEGKEDEEEGRGGAEGRR